MRAMRRADREVLDDSAHCARWAPRPMRACTTGRDARLLQCRHLSHREGGGVLNRLLALNTGRGHCRARILRLPRPGRNGQGAVLVAAIPSSR